MGRKRKREKEKDISTNKQAKVDEPKLLAGGGSIELSQPDDDSNKQERRTSPRLKNDPCFYCDNNSYGHFYYGLGFCNDCAGESGINVSIALKVPIHKIKKFTSSEDLTLGEINLLDFTNLIEAASERIVKKGQYNPFFSLLVLKYTEYFSSESSLELIKRRLSVMVINLAVFLTNNEDVFSSKGSGELKVECNVGFRQEGTTSLTQLYPSLLEDTNTTALLLSMLSGMSLPYPSLTLKKYEFHLLNLKSFICLPKKEYLLTLRDSRWQNLSEPVLLISSRSSPFSDILKRYTDERVKAVETASKSLLKKEKRKRNKQQKAEKAKAEKIKATPVKVKKPKNLYDAFVASPNGERFPPRRNSAGADDCNCSINKVTPGCALHSNWKAKFDSFKAGFN
jgi:hypothetical protein